MTPLPPTHLATARSWIRAPLAMDSRVSVVTRRLGVACVPILALLPSLVWIGRDQAVWLWDQAYYGEASVTLYYALRYQPTRWPSLMLHTFGTRAPGIAWFGQFFVPVGLALNSVEFGLKLPIVLAQALTLVVLFGAYRQLVGGGPSPALVGCLAVGQRRHCLWR